MSAGIFGRLLCSALLWGSAFWATGQQKLLNPQSAQALLESKSYSLKKKSDTIIGTMTWVNPDSTFDLKDMRYFTNKIEEMAVREKNVVVIAGARLGWVFLNRYSMPAAQQYKIALDVLDMGDSAKNDNICLDASAALARIFSQNDIPGKAVFYYRKMLDYAKKTGNTERIQHTYYNLGFHYYSVLKIDSAIHYLEKSVALIPVVKNPVDGAYELQSLLARSYARNKEVEKALQIYYRLKPLYLQKTYLMANAYQYMGDLHSEHMPDSTLYYAKKSLELDPVDPAKKMMYVKALELCKKFNEATYELDKMRLEMNDYPAFFKDGVLEMCALVYTRVGRKDDALQCYMELTSFRDSIRKAENMNDVLQQDMSHNFEKELEMVELQQKQKDLEAQNEKDRQKLINTGLLVGLALVVVFTVLLFSRFRLINRQKKIIDVQKTVLETRNKEVIDSINYARRIQYALLAHDELLRQNLPEHFVFFQPKDIVSGDFYWATKIQGSKFGVQSSNTGQTYLKPETLNLEQGNAFYLAVCDSTGHGVPGAFMSLLNISFLNEAINEKHITDPGKILDHVRQRLIENISQEGAQDGMDGILVKFEISNLKPEISYAAANNAPYIKTASGMQELPFDKMPVGKSIHTQNFATHRIDYRQGDTLYLLTDGFADQFGGDKGKKFKLKNLVALLEHNVTQPMEQQRANLEQELHAWKGDLEQVDDVCVIGIRI